MNPHGTRTRQAVEWLLAPLAPGEPKRTQWQAAERFGISQPTIAGAMARVRPKCPTCGQRVKGDVMPAPAPQAVLASGPSAAHAVLAEAIGKYAWHLGDCPAYETGDGECRCGFAEVERVAADATA